MDDKKRAPDEKREAEDLTDDKTRPAGPGQPVDVRKMPKDRRIFGNDDASGMARTTGRCRREGAVSRYILVGTDRDMWLMLRRV